MATSLIFSSVYFDLSRTETYGEKILLSHMVWRMAVKLYYCVLAVEGRRTKRCGTSMPSRGKLDLAFLIVFVFMIRFICAALLY